jgi:hypothetical protein
MFAEILLCVVIPAQVYALTRRLRCWSGWGGRGEEECESFGFGMTSEERELEREGLPAAEFFLS